jgi:hypothetical protein
MAKQAQINEVRPVLEAIDGELDKVETFLNTLDAVADKGSNAVESGLEKVADAVPDALDTTVHVSTGVARRFVGYFRSPKHAALTIVGVSMVAGAGLGVLGYFATVKHVKSKMQAEFDERLEAEIEEMRKFYARRNKAGEFSTPEAAAEALLTKEAAAALRSYSGKDGDAPLKVERGEAGEPKNIEIVGEPVVETENVASEEELAALREKLSGGSIEPGVTTAHNIFAAAAAEVENFDFEAEAMNRSSGDPYVITHREFMENENDWQQNSLTYYNGDDTLADDQQVPIPDSDDIVGGENLARFGDGSNDPRVVYVCNEKVEALYEITLNDGTYSEQVAGFQHSAPLRRFRQGRDE